MQRLTIHATTTSQSIILCRPGRVSINGNRRRDLKVLSWLITGPPSFGQLTIALDPSRSSVAPSQIEAISHLPEIGSAVTVSPANGFAGEDFSGIITAHELSVSDSGEQLVAHAQHVLAGELGLPVQSRWQLKSGAVIEVPAGPVRFNFDDNSLASASAVTVNGRQARVFDTSDSAQRWTVADAIGYLIATAVPNDIEVPSSQELQSLAGQIDLARTDITGKTIAKALEQLASQAGLNLRASLQGRGIVLYRPGVDGRRRKVRLQPAGATLSADRSNLYKGRVLFYRRPARPTILALGQHKRYESTFALKPGWDPLNETDRWRDFIPDGSDSWPAKADVYRKWVLNEHGLYTGAPWNLALNSLSAVSSEDFLLDIPRIPLECLSREPSGKSLGYVVETRLNSSDTWRIWPRPVWISKWELAVYLGGSSLPGDFFQAAVVGDAEVRLTATIEADTRLTATIDGDSNAGIETVDLSSQAAYRKVHSASVFADDAQLGSPLERDDTVLLNHLARRHVRDKGIATTAELTLGWVDTSYHVGDIVDRIDGRSLELAASPEARPFVQSVQHDFGPDQTTNLVVKG